MSEVVGKLAASLAAETPVLCAWVGMNEPAVAEALAREAFDAVVLDLQHGAFDFTGATRAILSVALAGKPSIIRAPVGEFALASRLLDAGAAGVIAPMINSRDDAGRLVAFTKFPPLGERSWGPRAALPLSGLEAPAYFARGQRHDPDDRHDRDARRRSRRSTTFSASTAWTGFSSARPTCRSR